jgi:hypothetical protein
MLALSVISSWWKVIFACSLHKKNSSEREGREEGRRIKRNKSSLTIST